MEVKFEVGVLVKWFIEVVFLDKICKSKGSIVRKVGKVDLFYRELRLVYILIKIFFRDLKYIYILS